jgi:HD-GYP domain-containing protein (c-di-GMP phosphodiesterase class II)
MGLDAERTRDVERVALLHDIGKVGIPDSILQKRGPLTDQEWELMHQHPSIGARILAATLSLARFASAVNAEHERFDGAGYPDGLSGEAIPLASRVTFACDAYHAMTSDRPYRAAMDPSAAQDEMRAGAGNQFDPDVVGALLAVLSDGQPERTPAGAQWTESDRDVLTAHSPLQAFATDAR